MPGYQIEHVKWITALEDEPIEDYTKRLAAKAITDPNPILLGMSFGGTIAIEIAKHIEVKKIILISSIKNKYELGIHYRIAGLLNLAKKIPAKRLKEVRPLTYKLFGITEPGEKDLLKQIVEDSDDIFYSWAANAISKWNNTIIPNDLIHIHGDKDFVLRMPKKVDHVIKGGGHFMVYNRAAEVSELILKALKS